jgi:hypothetical protein
MYLNGGLVVCYEKVTFNILIINSFIKNSLPYFKGG